MQMKQQFSLRSWNRWCKLQYRHYRQQQPSFRLAFSTTYNEQGLFFVCICMRLASRLKATKSEKPGMHISLSITSFFADIFILHSGFSHSHSMLTVNMY